jgi:hypothetical protein
MHMPIFKPLYNFLFTGIIIIFITTGFNLKDATKRIQKTAEPASAVDSLTIYFKNPPPSYSLLPFWSLNNTLDTTKMHWQMDQMLEKGIFGAFMHAREGLNQSTTPYFSDGWWTGIESAVKYAHKKGFYTYLYDEDKWPSGSAGGRTIKANPERNIKKILRYSEFQTVGPQTLEINFATNPYAIFAGKISDRGVYDYSSQINLTALAGKEWQVPPGKWAIITFTAVKDPQNQINYMDSSTVADFLHITHDEYYKRLGPFFGNTIKGVFFDEIYANSSERRNNIFWSEDFIEQFKKYKGYDFTPYLPLMIFNDPTISPLKRYDFFDVVRLMYGKAWFGQYAKWAEDHHIFVTGHTTEELIQYIRQSDYYFTQGQLQVPCTDNEDFRYGYPREVDFYNAKQISSIGHLYGRERMAAEALGSGGYTIPLEEYRYGFSMLGVYGVNMFIPHLFHYSMDRPENQADWPPSWFYQNPYWKYFKPLANYAQRIAYMVAQGKHICRVALVYPLTQIWLGGYSTPVDDDYFREVQKVLLDNHIDYDVIDPTTLAAASVQNKKLHAGTEDYEVVVLPDLKAIQSKSLSSINQFVANGGIAIGLKSLPSASEKGNPIDPFVVKSMTALFGFQPREIGQIQYRSSDIQRQEHFITHKNIAGGKGIFSRYVELLPSIIQKETTADIIVEGEATEWLRYQHRKIDKREVFYFVNSQKKKASYTVSMQEIGKPQLWNPETGAITDITNYRIFANRLELSLDFKPWESYFVVIDKSLPVRNQNLLITASDVDFVGIAYQKNALLGQYWSTGNGKHTLQYKIGHTVKTKEWQGAAALPAVAINGNWDFQLSPKALDNIWTSTLTVDTLSLPVMQFSQAPNRGWKNIKVADAFSGIKGASRYVSYWNAAWISYYDNSMHLPEVGGGTVYFKKIINVKDAIKTASIDITADQSFVLSINGKLVGKHSDWKTPVHYEVTDFLKKGENTFYVVTTQTKGLLLEGAIGLQNGTELKIQSNASWEASKDETNWQQAFVYALPPLGNWGNIVRPNVDISFPQTVTYRQWLPPGAEAILPPNIKGKYVLYVNGNQVQFEGTKSTNIKPFLQLKDNVVTLEVVIENFGGGLQDPLQVICGKVSLPLGAWSVEHLGWYSGRVMYTHEVSIENRYCNANTKLLLDLGKVNHFAEIWINDKLVGARSWAPFEADISQYIHPGKNKITVVVTNLLANAATWNILDANIDNKDARWWHDGSIMRESEQLISGLLGPVRITPYIKGSIEL